MSDSLENAKRQRMLDITSFFASYLGVGGFVGTILVTAAKDMAWYYNLAVSLVCGSIAFGAIRLWISLASRGSVFHLVGKDKGGKVLNNHVMQAEESIFFTHFTGEPPHSTYLASLSEKLEEGVPMKRLIYFIGDSKSSKYTWLKNFEGNSYYEQIAVSAGLPFNVVIIDHKTVWLFFPLNPGAYFLNAIWFTDPNAAKLFEVMLQSWELSHKVKDHPRNYLLAQPALFDGDKSANITHN